MKPKQVFPFLNWLSNYKANNFKVDSIAGLTVAILLIPQSMAYALLAGMPPIYGLYAGLVPLFVYALFGSSYHLSIGPVAIISLLIFSGVSPIASTGSPEYIVIVLTVSFLVGLLQILLSFLKMGFLVNFLSTPVIVGFTSAAAIIISINQFKYILGFNIPRFDYTYEILFYAFQNIDQSNVVSISISLATFCIIYFLYRINKKIPAALISIFVGVCCSKIFNLQAYGIKIVGEIPRGLPKFQLPVINFELLETLIPLVLSITIIGIVQSLSIAKLIESNQQTYTVKPNQELFALGISKMVGSFFHALPSFGSFGRSIVNFESGAVTPMSSIVTSVTIGLCLLFLTPLFYHIPLAMLAGIILFAIRNLFAFKEATYLWGAQKSDFIMMLATFFVTLILGIEQGVLTGVVLSILTVLYRSSSPHIAILGNIPNTEVYRNISRFGQLDTAPEIIIIRFDDQLYFANASYFRDFVFELVNERKEKIDLFVLDASSIHRIDSTGLQVLKEVDIFLGNQNIQLYLSGVIGPVRDRLYKFGVMRKSGEKNYFLRIHDAVQHYKQLQKDKNSNVWTSTAVQNNIAKK